MPRAFPIGRRVAGGAALLALALLPAAAAVAQSAPFVEVRSRYDFAETVSRLETAVQASPVGLVTRASAQAGARSLGVSIPGNQVWGLFAPRFAVRMLKASVAAGFEAPVRLYLIERADGTALVRYRKPSVVFAPYGQPDLDAMARELDAIFARIAGAVR